MPAVSAPPAPEQYEKNLRELVKRLKATGAKLVWASTTPIRHSSTQRFRDGLGDRIQRHRRRR